MIDNNIEVTSSADSFIQIKKQDQNADRQMTVNLVSACMKGILQSIPPSFCYKKDADAGVIPTGCPDNFFRYGALCYENCVSNYRFVLGTCWEDCPGGYSDHGLTCFKWNWFKSRTIWKGSYIPKPLTNFDDRVPCPNEMYKSGALCYRDCNKAGLINCGIGACATSTEACISGIGIMTLNFALSLAQTITLVVSLGSSSVATPAFAAAKSAFSNFSKSAMKSALSQLAKSFTRQAVKDRIVASGKHIAKSILNKVPENMVEVTCNSVASDVIKSATKTVPNELSLSSLDPTGISSVVSNCGNITTENSKLMCAQAVLTSISAVDVTGLTGMAAALIQPICPWV